jgi:hypothetical protein
MTQPIMNIKGTVGEMACMVAELHALRYLFAITFTFLFWVSLSILLVVLYLLKIIHSDQILSVHSYLSFVGMSPILLTILTWRLVGKLLDKYVKWFLKTHVQVEKT